MKNLEDFIKHGHELMGAVSPEALAAFDRLIVDYGKTLHQDDVPLAYTQLEMQRIQSKLHKLDLRAQVRVKEHEQSVKERAATSQAMMMTFQPLLTQLSGAVMSMVGGYVSGKQADPSRADSQKKFDALLAVVNRACFTDEEFAEVLTKVKHGTPEAQFDVLVQIANEKIPDNDWIHKRLVGPLVAASRKAVAGSEMAELAYVLRAIDAAKPRLEAIAKQEREGKSNVSVGGVANAVPSPVPAPERAPIAAPPSSKKGPNKVHKKKK